MGKEVKKTNSWVWKKIFGITLLGWMNILIFQWLFIRISYHWIYVDPKNDDDARTFIFWDAEKTAVCCKNFLLLCHYRVYYTSNWVVGRLCNAVQIQMPFN